MLSLACSPARAGLRGSLTMSWASGLQWAPSQALVPQIVLRHISREAKARLLMLLLQAVSSLLTGGRDRSQGLTWELAEIPVTSGSGREVDSIGASFRGSLTGWVPGAPPVLPMHVLISKAAL